MECLTDLVWWCDRIGCVIGCDLLIPLTEQSVLFLSDVVVRLAQILLTVSGTKVPSLGL